MIVDAHCHAGKGDLFTGPWDTNAPLDSYLRRAREAGIHRSVIFAAFHSDFGRANEDVARIAARHPGRFWCFAFVHPLRDRGRIDALVTHAVTRLGFCGIKAHGHMGPATRELADVARKLKLPVLYDVAGKPDIIDLLAPEYPDVNFIIPHLGSFADDWSAHVRVIDQICRLPNVFTDTSGVRRFDYLVEAVRRAGPSKVIFGSDGPWLHPGLELHKIRLLKLDPASEGLILGGNILRLLNRQDVALQLQHARM